MKLLRSIFLAPAVFSIFFIPAAYPGFNQQEFEKYASEYGYKAANLNELAKIIPSLNAKMPGRYQVPAFFPLGNTEVQEFLSKTMMPDKSMPIMDFITQQLEQFKKLQSSATTNALTQESIALLESIEKVIEQVLASQPFTLESAERQKGFAEFLAKIAEQKDLLMVRSTGKEDTKELANAGGNKSIAAVKPDIATVSKAMGEVIASYFGKKSISQRLLANDKTIFDKPFMPVLPQVMIGKNPVSGVMFSTEAEGHTPGVTHIQATYGHGEGVVNGLVPVDTFYIGPSMLVHPLIRIKEYRLAPSADFSHLERVANSAQQSKNSCLSAEIVRDLKSGADIIQNYYGYPVDIEFVVENNIIYLVQARPIVSKDSAPSYLKDEFIASATQKLPVFTIITAGGAVRIIDQASALIIDDNIRKALDTFLDPKTNKDLVHAVASGELAPATSHEGTTFRGADKAVVYLDTLAPLRTLISGNKFPLLIDVQRGLIIPFEPSDQFMSPDAALIKNAWFVHPIPKKTSLFPQYMQMKISKEIKPEEVMPDKKTSQLLDIIKNGSFGDAGNALKSLLARISQTIVVEQKKEKEKSVNPHIIAQLKNVFAHAMSSAHEVLAALQHWDRSAKTIKDRLSRLYPMVFFEAIITQIPMPKEFVNDYSFGSALKTELQEQKISKELAMGPDEARAFAVQYAKAAEYALAPELATQWNTYIKSISTLPQEKQQQFARMVYELAKDTLTPLWLNVSFVRAQEKEKSNPARVTQALLQEFAQSQPLLAQLHAIQESINAINLENWQKPELFQKQWSNFQKTILDPLFDPAFNQQYEKSPDLGKMAALNLLNNVVNIFDISIKSLKSSREYKDQNELISRVKSMVAQYFNLLKKLVALPSIQEDLKRLIDTFSFKATEDYFDAIARLFYQTKAEDSDELLPSRFFNVAAAALGSKAQWYRSIGSNVTLEDIFSLIHQNLLIVLRTLNKKLGIDQTLVIPPLLAAFKSALEKKSFTAGGEGSAPAKASLIGVSFEGDKLIYYYNIPLRNHSCTVQILYDMKSKTINFAMQFLGEARSRFSLMVVITRILTVLFDLTLFKEPVIDPRIGQLELVVSLSRQQQISQTIQLLELLIKATFDTNVLAYAAYMARDADKQIVDKILQSLISLEISDPVMNQQFARAIKIIASKNGIEGILATAQKLLKSQVPGNTLMGMKLLSESLETEDDAASSDNLKKIHEMVIDMLNTKINSLSPDEKREVLDQLTNTIQFWKFEPTGFTQVISLFDSTHKKKILEYLIRYSGLDITYRKGLLKQQISSLALEDKLEILLQIAQVLELFIVQPSSRMVATWGIDYSKEIIQQEIGSLTPNDQIKLIHDIVTFPGLITQSHDWIIATFIPILKNIVTKQLNAIALENRIMLVENIIVLAGNNPQDWMVNYINAGIDALSKDQKKSLIQTITKTDQSEWSKTFEYVLKKAIAGISDSGDKSEILTTLININKVPHRIVLEIVAKEIGSLNSRDKSARLRFMASEWPTEIAKDIINAQVGSLKPDDKYDLLAYLTLFKDKFGIGYLKELVQQESSSLSPEQKKKLEEKLQFEPITPVAPVNVEEWI